MIGIATSRLVPSDGPGTRWAAGWCGGAVLVAFLGLAGPLKADGAAGSRISAEATGALRAREAQGWLQLDTDQRAARARVEPLTPLESQQVQIQERQERNRLAETYQDQQREIDALRAAERRNPDPGLSQPGREAWMRGLLMRQGSELDGLRLRQGMARERLGAPASPYLRR